jgi:DNA ligase-associated metallophosphoesterase
MIQGIELDLLPSRALWWPAERTLVLADLHLGKEETFLSFGIPMPRNVLGETLERAARAVVEHRPERIIVVGDLMHAKRGLSKEVVDEVARWRSRIAQPIELVLGNHDVAARLPSSWRIDVHEKPLRIGNVELRHEPPEDGNDGQATSAALVVCGHLHPVARLEGRVDRLVLPCFALSRAEAQRVLVLPAFTAFARGVRMPEESWRRFAVGAGAVVDVG